MTTKKHLDWWRLSVSFIIDFILFIPIILFSFGWYENLGWKLFLPIIIIFIIALWVIYFLNDGKEEQK